MARPASPLPDHPQARTSSAQGLLLAKVQERLDAELLWLILRSENNPYTVLFTDV